MIFSKQRIGIEKSSEPPGKQLVSSEEKSCLEERVSSIAQASVALSRLAPDLSQLANEMAEGAERQARDATAIAEQASAMAVELERAIGELKHSSSSIGEIVHSIRRLADQSKILAINASIEAANAGASGRAFGAVAVEVESLAGRTSAATRDVGDKVGAIECGIRRAVHAAGLEGGGGGGVEAHRPSGLSGFCSHMESIASVARQNSASAQRVAEAGDSVRTLC